ncbi:MAG: DapH/DapD/GlmU-related protein [Rhodocyclaceae bacterium]
MGKAARYIAHNGVWVFALELLRRASANLRGRVYRRIFVAEAGTIGTGAYIRGLSAIRIEAGFRCGKNLWLEALGDYRGTSYTPSLRIARNVSLSDNVHISSVREISIGNDVLIGSNVYIGDHGHGRYDSVAPSLPGTAPADRSLYSRGPIVIGDRVWIGDGVVICGGVIIGSGAVVGANSVVVRDIPADCLAVGMPARVVKRFSAVDGWLKSESVNTHKHE